MSSTRYSVHDVVSIGVKFDQAPDAPGGWMTFSLRDRAGGYHDITAFVDGPVAIDGADFINFMASEPMPQTESRPGAYHGEGNDPSHHQVL